MSFLVAGRNKNALRFARGKLTQLKTAAEVLGLRNSEAWRSDFSIGYQYRHSLLGLELAKDAHWSGWFQRDYPGEQVIRATFLDSAPSVFDIDREWLSSRYDRMVEEMSRESRVSPEPKSDFARGVMWADRVLHSCLRVIRQNDPIALQVQDLERRYHSQFGTKLGNLVGFRRPDRYYKFLVAHTLGPKAFSKTFSDVELARLLNKKST